MATLQKQGVPIPDKLNGPNPNGPQTRSAAPSRSNRGTAPQRATRSSSKSVSNRKSRSTAGPESVGSTGQNPGSGMADTGASVGLLEAEFLTALGILVLLMFSDTSSDLTDKMMNVMKRGTLICAVFFILAIVSGIGPNAAKSAKAFGALVIVAILVTSPISTVLTDIDGIIKNDWIGNTPQAPAKTGSSGTAGTNQSSPNSPSSLLQDVEKAASATVNGILPVSQVKSLLGKIGINIP